MTVKNNVSGVKKKNTYDRVFQLMICKCTYASNSEKIQLFLFKTHTV